jgi:hypothetical protein
MKLSYYYCNYYYYYYYYCYYHYYFYIFCGMAMRQLYEISCCALEKVDNSYNG